VRQHVDHARNTLRRAGVDARDAALGDGRADHARVGKAGHIELAGIFGGTGNLRDPVDTRRGGANVGIHGPAPSALLQYDGLARHFDRHRAAGPGKRSNRRRAREDAAAAHLDRSTCGGGSRSRPGGAA
jgi:hypothetical protein